MTCVLEAPHWIEDGVSVVVETESAVVEVPSVEPALVHQPVVGRTQQDEVPEGSLPAVGPAPHVVAVQPGKRHPRSRLRSARRSAGEGGCAARS